MSGVTIEIRTHWYESRPLQGSHLYIVGDRETSSIGFSLTSDGSQRPHTLLQQLLQHCHPSHSAALNPPCYSLFASSHCTPPSVFTRARPDTYKTAEQIPRSPCHRWRLRSALPQTKSSPHRCGVWCRDGGELPFLYKMMTRRATIASVCEGRVMRNVPLVAVSWSLDQHGSSL